MCVLLKKPSIDLRPLTLFLNQLSPNATFEWCWICIYFFIFSGLGVGGHLVAPSGPERRRQIWRLLLPASLPFDWGHLSNYPNPSVNSLNFHPWLHPPLPPMFVCLFVCWRILERKSCTITSLFLDLDGLATTFFFLHFNHISILALSVELLRNIG